MGNMRTEKRKAPRAKDNLPIKIMEGEETLVVETKDVSASGVYCTTQKAIPLMSRVALTMLLPAPGNKKCKVECGGTVVRVTPTRSGDKSAFEVAIFFDNITDQARMMLERHVKSVISGG